MTATHTSPPELTTAYHSPWALVRWGGDEIGKRPRTRFGFIKEAVAKDNKIVGYRLYTANGAGRWTKRPALYVPGCILKTWRQRPDDAALRKAKAALTPLAIATGSAA